MTFWERLNAHGPSPAATGKWLYGYNLGRTDMGLRCLAGTIFASLVWFDVSFFGYESHWWLIPMTIGFTTAVMRNCPLYYIPKLNTAKYD